MESIPINREKNVDRLRAFEKIHHGQRAFIIGNGPSLTISDLNRLVDEITFASNKIFLAFDSTRWRPTYYAVEDKLVMKQNYERIKKLNGFHKFFPTYLDQWFDRIPGAAYFTFDTAPFFPNRPKFSTDMTNKLYWGSTITYTLIQMAWYMGISEIYLIGVDHEFRLSDVKDKKDPNILISQGERNHFHPEYRKPGEKWFVPNLDVSLQSYEAAKEAIEVMGGHVYNATRGGKLKVFPKVDFDSLLTE